MSFIFTGTSNSSVQNDVLAKSFQNRSTFPLAQAAITNPQREGSMIFDPRLDKLYISDGTQWLEIVASPNGNVVCIADDDGDTSVCTDTVPGTDSDTIVFTNAGTESARITSTGVLSVGSTTPAAGKIAHFEGDIKVTGVVDPTGTQYEEGADHPVDPTGSTTGVVWVRDTNPNELVFTDNMGIDHVVGGGAAVETLAATLAAGNVTGGTDIEITQGDDIRGVTDGNAGDGTDVPIVGGTSSTQAGGSVSLTGGETSSVTGSSAGDVVITGGEKLLFDAGAPDGADVVLRGGAGKNMFLTDANFGNVYVDVGNFGAGLNNPAYPLHVQNAAGAALGFIPSAPTTALLENSNGGCGLSLISTAGPAINSSSLNFGTNVSESQGLIRYFHSTDSMHFFTDGNTTLANSRLGINSTGQVLVNTNTPNAAEALSVNGDAYVNGKLTVTGLIDPTGFVGEQQTSTPYNPNTVLAGTVSVTAGMTAVTGAGTSFLTDFASLPLLIKIGAEVRQVASVTDNLNLTLSTPHTAGAAGVAYSRSTLDGTIWVRDDNPNSNNLVFTDNCGVDHDLTGAGMVETLAETLVAGNETGGTDIIMTEGDSIVGEAGGNAGVGSNVNIVGGAGQGLGTFNGGDVLLTGGLGINNGTGGSITLQGGSGNSIGNVTCRGENITLVTQNSGAGSGDVSISSGDIANSTGDVSIFSGDGTVAGTVSLTGGEGTGTAGPVMISGGNAAAASTIAGGGVTISGGTGDGAGVGGTVTLNGGIPGATGNGGSININARNGGSTSGDGGDVGISSGAAGSGADSGGDISIVAGDVGAMGVGVGGDVTIASGSGTGDGTSSGDVSISAPTGSSGGGSITATAGAGGDTAGNVTITAGAGSGLSNDGGDVTVTAGNSSNADGGSIILNPGTGAVNNGEVTVNGKLTVTGLIDPTGFVGNQQSAIPFNPSTSLTGTVSVTAGMAAVVGVGTLFTTELALSDWINIAGEIRQVMTITDNLNLTLATNHTAGAAGVAYSLLGTQGTIWVRDDVPTSLVYTDSNGTTTDLSGAGAVDTLAETLVAGNVTGGTNISVTNGDSIVTAVGNNPLNLSAGSNPAGAASTINLTAGTSTGNTGGSVNLFAGNGTTAGDVLASAGNAEAASNSNGGDVVVAGGSGDGSGSGGTATLSGGLGANGGTTIVEGGGGTTFGGTLTARAGSGPTGGTANLQGGTGSTNGGSANVSGGSGSSSGGSVNVNGGNASSGGGGNVSVTAGGSSGGTAGGTINITSGGGGLSGDGGPVNINGSTGANGGAVSISGGTGSTTAGGSISITAGVSNAAGSTADVTITGGANSTVTASGGDVTLTGGTGNSSGGDVNVNGGTGTNGLGGSVNITSAGGGAGGNGGGVSVTSGNGAAGGSISIIGGSSTTGTAGSFSFAGGSASANNGIGGSATLNCGDGFGSGGGGSFSVTGGDGGNNLGSGGTITMTCGNGGTNGGGGGMTLTGGNAGSGPGGGGAMTITGGGGNSGGIVSLSGGSSSGLGARGANVSLTPGGGPGGNGNVVINGTSYTREIATTTAVATVDIETISIPTDSVSFIRTKVVGRRTTATGGAVGDSYVFVQESRVKNVSGTVTLVALPGAIDSSDAGAWTVGVVVSGTNILVQVDSGLAGTDIDWISQSEIMNL
jgi:hypothetical protein